jgi:hypothetical protein
MTSSVIVQTQSSPSARLRAGSAGLSSRVEQVTRHSAKRCVPGYFRGVPTGTLFMKMTESFPRQTPSLLLMKQVPLA